MMIEPSALPVATRHALARGAVQLGDMLRQASRGPLTCSPCQRLELPATMPTGYRLACDGGRVDITGSPAVLSVAHVLRAEPASVATIGEPVAFLRSAPADDGTRRLADRGRRLRALAVADIDLREHACDLITAASSPAPARKLAADLGLAMNRRQPRKAKRDAAIAELAEQNGYCGLQGQALCLAIIKDLNKYAAGGWRHDRDKPNCPHTAADWHAPAWAILRTPAQRQNLIPAWETIWRVVNKKSQ